MRTQSERVASREYLEILQLAAQGSESLVEGALAKLLDQGGVISVAAVRTLLGSDTDLSVAAQVWVPAVDLRIYDELLLSLAEVRSQAQPSRACGSVLGRMVWWFHHSRTRGGQG